VSERWHGILDYVGAGMAPALVGWLCPLVARHFGFLVIPPTPHAVLDWLWALLYLTVPPLAGLAGIYLKMMHAARERAQASHIKYLVAERERLLEEIRRLRGE
jgi:hypothetical protein